MTTNKNSFALMSGPLTNRYLIAVPSMGDTHFSASVIYVCSHSETEGTIGLVLNKACPVKFVEVLKQLGIQAPTDFKNPPVVLWGGPVEPIRGFILHSNDYKGFETSRVTDTLSLTVSVDVIADTVKGNGPKDSLFALGYSSWEPGQLELEIAGNSWFVTDADNDFLFHCPASQKWKRALSMIGVDPLMLSLEQGSA